MTHTVRTALGAAILAAILTAYFLSAAPARAAMQGERAVSLQLADLGRATSLSDPRVSGRVERLVKQVCGEAGDPEAAVERSICVAHTRKNAYRAAAQAIREQAPLAAVGDQ
jgi:hypothetical protein